MLSIAKEEHRLARLTTAGLKEEHATLFGEEIAGNNKTWILRRILWRLQARAEGDLSERARRKAAELADDTHLRVVPPPEMRTPEAPGALKRDARLPLPGSTISRLYKGAMVEVHVREDGFEYAGEVHKTLSAVAKAVTGSHCNGFLFFNLNRGNA